MHGGQDRTNPFTSGGKSAIRPLPHYFEHIIIIIIIMIIMTVTLVYQQPEVVGCFTSVQKFARERSAASTER